MTVAVNHFLELQSLPAKCISSAIFLCIRHIDFIDELESYTDYLDSKNCFLYVKINYTDDSSLKIHRNGDVTLYLECKKLDIFNIHEI